LISVHAAYPDLFTTDDLIRFTQLIGMTLTSASKDAEFGDISYDEATFLKRGFRSHKGMFLPTLSVQSIEAMLEWNRKSDDATAACIVNIDAALRFAYFHGKQYFDQLRSRISKSLREARISYVLPTYEYFDALFLESGELACSYFD